MSYIYKITNDVNNQIYIGQTRGALETRLKEHLYDARKYKDNSKFHQAIRDIGEEHFSISVLEECEQKNLDEKERYWIAKLDTYYHGYNSSMGGQNNPYHTDIEVAIQYYLDNKDKKTLTQITNELRIQPNRLRELLEERGLRDKQFYSLYQDWTQEEKDAIINDIQNGKTMFYITEKYHHDHRTIEKLLKENNIEYKPQGPVKGKGTPIIQLTLNDEFVKEWPSIFEARQFYNNRHIGEVCSGKRKSAAGYKWRYK